MCLKMLSIWMNVDQLAIMSFSLGIEPNKRSCETCSWIILLFTVLRHDRKYVKKWNWFYRCRASNSRKGEVNTRFGAPNWLTANTTNDDYRYTYSLHQFPYEMNLSTCRHIHTCYYSLSFFSENIIKMYAVWTFSKVCFIPGDWPEFDATTTTTKN